MRDIQINDRMISSSGHPFVIAEMSGNHNHSLERALAIVEAAARSGVHALKLQTYTADTMTLDIDEGEFFIDDPCNLWKGNSLYKLYQEAYTPWEWHKPIFDKCKELGVVGFSTPFDEIIEGDRAKAMLEGFARRQLKEELCRRCGYRKRFNV